MRCCTEIVRRLIEAHHAGKSASVNLNSLKSQVSKKLNCQGTPKLVDIISAVPHEYKEVLLPKLKARPVRTASGVRQRSLSQLQTAADHDDSCCLTDCCCCSHVQAAQVSAHRHDRQHLRVSMCCLRLQRSSAMLTPLLSVIALVDQTQTLSTARSPTRCV